MSRKKSSLGDRMKHYEDIPRTFLSRRIPAVIRLDGKAFHTFTRGMRKPFDRILMAAMQNTMRYLCENIQGCVFGYTQSDEITLVLTDYATVTTDAWFGYNVQKMVSVSASMATLAFNQFFIAEVSSRIEAFSADEERNDEWAYLMMLEDSRFFRAMFDARAFSVPKDDVCNCLIWRQQDATRNSIEAVGQANFSHGELCCKSLDDIQEMLWSRRNINWNDFPTDCKRGCCYRTEKTFPMCDPRTPEREITVSRKAWIIDREPPIFTRDRDYVERWL